MADSAPNRWNPCASLRLAAAFAVGIVIGVAFILGAGWVQDKTRETYVTAQASDLWNVYRLWVEAGRPTEIDLTDFARRFDSAKCVIKQMAFEYQGTHYRTIFSDPDLDGFGTGSLFVTEDGAVFWDKGTTFLARKSLP